MFVRVVPQGGERAAVVAMEASQQGLGGVSSLRTLELMAVWVARATVK